MYRRFPRPRSIVPSLVRDAFAVRAVPSPGPQVYHRYHTPPSTLHRSFSRGVTVVPFPVDAAPPHPPLGYRRPFPRACSPPSPFPASHHRPFAHGLPSSLSPPSASHRRLLSRPWSPSPSKLHHSLHRRFPHTATVVASPVNRSIFQTNNHHPLPRARSFVRFPSKQTSSVPSPVDRSIFQANNHHPLPRARSLVRFPSKQTSSVPPFKILGPFRPLTLLRLRPRHVVPFPC